MFGWWLQASMHAWVLWRQHLNVRILSCNYSLVIVSSIVHSSSCCHPRRCAGSHNWTAFSAKTAWCDWNYGAGTHPEVSLSMSRVRSMVNWGSEQLRPWRATKRQRAFLRRTRQWISCWTCCSPLKTSPPRIRYYIHLECQRWLNL